MARIAFKFFPGDKVKVNWHIDPTRVFSVRVVNVDINHSVQYFVSDGDKSFWAAERELMPADNDLASEAFQDNNEH